jgi:hypothetical protein
MIFVRIIEEPTAPELAADPHGIAVSTKTCHSEWISSPRRIYAVSSRKKIAQVLRCAQNDRLFVMVLIRLNP